MSDQIDNPTDKSTTIGSKQGDEGELSVVQANNQFDVVNHIGEEPIPLRMSSIGE